MSEPSLLTPPSKSPRTPSLRRLFVASRPGHGRCPPRAVWLQGSTDACPVALPGDFIVEMTKIDICALSHTHLVTYWLDRTRHTPTKQREKERERAIYIYIYR